MYYEVTIKEVAEKVEGERYPDSTTIYSQLLTEVDVKEVARFLNKEKE